MSRNYNMIHRVSYQQIIDTLKKFAEPVTYERLYDNLPCEPDYLVLQNKLDKMADKGMIKKEYETTIFGRILYSIREYGEWTNISKK